MKDRLLYLTIGVLIGIVVMQWTMPAGQASIVTAPVGDVVAVAYDMVIARDGRLWSLGPQTIGGPWFDRGTLPVPVSEARFFSYVPGSLWAARIVDADGNVWLQTGPNSWENYGSPPVSPVPTSPDTWGGVKGKYEGNK
jgi:hypothetical protein